ncbi:hypothetical protein TWF481_011004 [Arthrobotrys musiformis]|uniref:F-box domain-containing protein n=1 Tax=Arthrobotrys musiformis TaxID=47236 RepID=A0AAV9VX16_9PEZI
MADPNSNATVPPGGNTQGTAPPPAGPADTQSTAPANTQSTAPANTQSTVPANTQSTVPASNDAQTTVPPNTTGESATGTPAESSSNSDSSSDSSDDPDDDPNDDPPTLLPSLYPALPVISTIQNVTIQRPSLLGQMPNEVLHNILTRLEQPSIGSFGLAASWCQAHADELFYRVVDLTPSAQIYLTLWPQHAPKIRELRVDCRYTQLINYNTTMWINSLPRLRTLSFCHMNRPAHCRVMQFMLKAISPIPTLRRLEISMGKHLIQQGTMRVASMDNPDWESLHMPVHPGLEEVSYDFGALASSITRLDALVFYTFSPHIATVKVLEVKVCEERQASQMVPTPLKHFIFRVAEEEINPTGSRNKELMDAVEALQQGYNSLMKSQTMEVFRFYSETKVGPTNEREINLPEVCRIWPNLKEIDFVTRQSWKTNFRTIKLDNPLTKVKYFVHPGDTKTRTDFGNPARDITDSSLTPTGPIVIAPRSVMDHLTRYYFPNIKTFGWYSRNSTANLSSGLGRITWKIRVNIIRDVWSVLHSGSPLLLTNIAVFWPGSTYLNHWWGVTTSIYQF